MIRIACLILVLALAACAAEAPVAKGPMFQMNPDRWTADENDLSQPPARQP
jgi:hypothetical protein